MNITITFDVDGTAAADIFSLLLKAAGSSQVVPPATVTKTGDGPLSVEPSDAAPPPASPKKPGASKEQMAKLREMAQAKKAAEAAAAAAEKAGPVETVLGPANAEDLSGNGADTTTDADEDMGLTPPSMSPAEAKEAGLALVRSIYASGHVAEVKELQRAWKITKFYDIPDAEGHAFYAQVVKLAQQTGIQR